MKEIVARMQKAVNKNNLLYKKILRLLNTLSKQVTEPEKNAFTLGALIDDIERTLALLEPQKKIRSEIRPSLDELRDRSDQLIEEARNKYIIDLEKASNASGVPFDGNFPHFRSGFFSVDVDLQAGHAVLWYGPGAEKMDTLSIEPDAICQAITGGMQQLSKPLDDDLFLRHLFAAYEVSLLKGEQFPGSPVPLSDILIELNLLKQSRQFRADPSKRTFQPYTRTAFSYDCYRLKERKFNGRKLTLVVATRAQTRKKEDHLWIPTNDRGDGTHYTSFYFKNLEGEML